MSGVDAEGGGPGDGAGEGHAPMTMYLVKQLELAIRALLDDVLRPYGVTTLQYTALTVLQDRGALSSAQLARRAFLRPQTMHQMVLTLEERGFIAREPRPGNGRALLARLTEAGTRLLDECTPEVRKLEHAMLADLSAGQRLTFREGLEHGITALTSLSRARRTRHAEADGRE